VFKISGDISWEMAASIPVSALTVYHALMQSKARFNEFIVIIGAFGNTGLFAVQFANIVGAKVIAVTRKNGSLWI
jgi:NADPH:quinone reductase-like Zn-dependent oxidoreductase